MATLHNLATNLLSCAGTAMTADKATSFSTSILDLGEPPRQIEWPLATEPFREALNTCREEDKGQWGKPDIATLDRELVQFFYLSTHYFEPSLKLAELIFRIVEAYHMKPADSDIVPFRPETSYSFVLVNEGKKWTFCVRPYPFTGIWEEAVAILKPGSRQFSCAASFQVEDNASKSSEETKPKPRSDGQI